MYTIEIDNLIANINSKNYESNNSQDEINDVITLISFSHCIDLFDFLENYSKIQKNELLFKIAFTYDMLGYNKKSLEFINEALRIIPNVPTIILFKSGLYASMNKLDEAQKYLLKFKYLIGEDIYNNYIYNCIRIVYYYLLEYEENIILREINLIERNFTEFYNDNVILYIGMEDPSPALSIQMADIGMSAVRLRSMPSPTYTCPFSWDSV